MKNVGEGIRFTVNVCAPEDENTDCWQYRGTKTEEDAQELTLKPGQVVTLPDFQIPWTAQPCHIVGMIRMPDGDKASGVRITKIARLLQGQEH